MGERFVSDPKMQLVKSVFLDFFRGREVKGMVFDGLMRLMVVIAVDSERLLLRQFKVSPRKQCRGNAVVNVIPYLDWMKSRAGTGRFCGMWTAI